MQLVSLVQGQSFVSETVDSISVIGLTNALTYLDSSSTRLAPYRSDVFQLDTILSREDLEVWQANHVRIYNRRKKKGNPLELYVEEKKLNIQNEELMEADSLFLKETRFDESYAFFYEHKGRQICIVYLAYMASVNLSNRYIFVIDVAEKRASWFLSYYIPPSRKKHKSLMYQREEDLLIAKYASRWEENATNKWRRYIVTLLKVK